MSRLTELVDQIETRFSTVRHVEETGSTNADLLAEAAAGAPEGLVLVADHQNAGRGRQNRSWHDEPGCSLLVSILLRQDGAVAPLIPLLAGVAAVDAIAALGSDTASADGDAAGESTGADLAGLKWPNDVLAPGLEERKLAGILSESSSVGLAAPPSGSGGAGPPSIVVVVGMGMNLRFATAPPPDIAARAATVGQVLGREVDRGAVLAPYLESFERHLADLESNGPAGLLAAYRARCLTIGRQVRFDTAAATHEGTVVDVSDSGTLLLDTGNDVVELHAGDAHHVPISND